MTHAMWRKLVLERDGYTCQECGACENLTAHHIKQWAYFPELGTDVSNGLTLCVPCHEKVEREQRRSADQSPIEGEVWRDVVGYEGVYSVSDFGRVRRDAAYEDRPTVILKAWLNRAGYYRVGLSAHNRKSTYFVHALVAAAFIGPLPPGQVVNHQDGVKTNNRPENLNYKTHAGNMRHASESGLMMCGDRHLYRRVPASVPRGDTHRSSKLTEADVMAIKASRTSSAQLAREYGVDRKTISCVRNHKSWNHVAVTVEQTDQTLRGERVGTSKLTEALVVAIRLSTVDRKTLGLQYGVSPHTIWDVQTRRRWKHVP
jgi:hypothetical protein